MGARRCSNRALGLLSRPPVTPLPSVRATPQGGETHQATDEATAASHEEDRAEGADPPAHTGRGTVRRRPPPQQPAHHHERAPAHQLESHAEIPHLPPSASGQRTPLFCTGSSWHRLSPATGRRHRHQRLFCLGDAAYFSGLARLIRPSPRDRDATRPEAPQVTRSRLPPTWETWPRLCGSVPFSMTVGCGIL